MSRLAPPPNPLAFMDPENRVDPYRAYRELLGSGPASVAGLGVVVPGFADCAELLRDARMSVDRSLSTMYQQLLEAGLQPVQEDLDAQAFLFLDPPEHTRLRRLVSRAFTRKAVDDLRPRIQELVDTLLDAAAERGRLELVGDLAYPLPVIVICDLLGVPADDHERFAGWSSALAHALDPVTAGAEAEEFERERVAVNEFREYFRELVARRRREPGDDLLSRLITLEEESARLTEEELLTTGILLLVAGHETTVTLISNAVLALLRNPDQFERLRADPSLAGRAVEETLRYDPPVQFTGRIATAPVPLGELTIEKGDVAFLLLAAAGRDPEAAQDPDRFDIGRADIRHLAFGAGVHFCLGAPLARLEGEITLNALARRLRDPRLRTDPPIYRANAVLRGPESLDIDLAGIAPAGSQAPGVPGFEGPKCPG